MLFCPRHSGLPTEAELRDGAGDRLVSSWSNEYSFSGCYSKILLKYPGNMALQKCHPRVLVHECSGGKLPIQTLSPHGDNASNLDLSHHAEDENPSS